MKEILAKLDEDRHGKSYDLRKAFPIAEKKDQRFFDKLVEKLSKKRKK